MAIEQGIPLIGEADQQSIPYRRILTDRERFIYECLFNLGLRTDRKRSLTVEELAEDFGVPRTEISMIYGTIITKLGKVYGYDEIFKEQE